MDLERYVIERRDGDPELDVPTAWVILTPMAHGGHYRRIAFTADKQWAERIKAALLWQESLGEGLLSLTQDGIKFDPKTGIPTPKPVRRNTSGMRKPSIAKPPAKKQRRK